MTKHCLTRLMAITLLFFLAILIGLAGLAVPHAAAEEAPATIERELPDYLPDWSNGRIGQLGPFIWGRALDLGEDARFADAEGRAKRDGDYLWLYQWARLPQDRQLKNILHARNNLVSRHKDLAYRIQPSHFILNTTGAHNSKIIIGYVQTESQLPFQHGDNADLAHLAAGDRVCLFLPVRPDIAKKDVLDQERYAVNTLVGIQPISILQFEAGKMIHYEWFKDEDNLDDNVLFNLAPYFTGENALKPGVTKPIFQFDIDGKGGWTLKIERDGRDGLAGGEVDDNWDLVFTHESKNAKPYTVNVTRENSDWALSTFSPGGRPMDTSEILIGLEPYNRDTGKKTDWPDRTRRIRDMKIEQLKRN